jgi:hypothetical protein
MKPFVSPRIDMHREEEENRWAKILAAGDNYASMILLYDQKLCAVAHEIKQGIYEGFIAPNHTHFYARRLADRIYDVMNLLKNSDLYFQTRDSLMQLISDLRVIKDARPYDSTDPLQEIVERIHTVSHELTDELSARVVR